MKTLPFLTAVACCTAGFSTAIHADSLADKGGYELKNRSVFRTDSDSRIPFWPIGWQRPKTKAGGAASEPVVETPTVQLLPGNFNISSILLGNPALVTINGRTFGEGEVLPVIYGTQRLRVVIRSIRDGGVWLDHEGQPTFIPMRRPEVGNRPSQQPVGAPEFTIKIAPVEK